MHAFFAMGPTLVPALPRTDLVHIQRTVAAAAAAAAGEAGEGGVEKGELNETVQMPVGGAAADAWRWLHPRLDAGKTHWDPVPIRPVDKTLKLEVATDSAIVEGYVLVQAGRTIKYNYR
ncbi:hypothetical protein BKA56DRAFT_610994 [Ilyonectria sp. MPI-CAGE-AT-0026]|nr:hypothetical protein BKA56DRAFT_610994 [Ilyonectria sp. MPI-CAGE-AT-0026]